MVKHTGPFSRNPEIGKTGRQIDRELDEVEQETIVRKAHDLDTEDQEAHEANLKEARGGLN